MVEEYRVAALHVIPSEGTARGADEAVDDTPLTRTPLRFVSPSPRSAGRGVTDSKCGTRRPVQPWPRFERNLPDRPFQRWRRTLRPERRRSKRSLLFVRNLL